MAQAEEVIGFVLIVNLWRFVPISSFDQGGQ